MGIGVFASLLTLLFLGPFILLVKDIASALMAEKIKSLWNRTKIRYKVYKEKRRLAKVARKMDTVDLSEVLPPLYERIFKAVANLFVSQADESVWNGYLGPGYYFLWSEEEESDDEGWAAWKESAVAHIPSLPSIPAVFRREKKATE